MDLHLPLVIVHIAAGALWFGGTLYAVSVLKRGLELTREGLRATTELAERMATASALGNLTSLASGVALIFVQYGSFKWLPKNFHAALGLVFVGTVVNFALLKPTLEKFNKLVTTEDYTRDSTAPLMKRLSIGQGINHLLWIGSLTLMYVRW